MLAIAMGEMKPALTLAQIDEFVHTFATALGTNVQPYDSTKGMAVFSVPGGANPYTHGFEVSDPNSSKVSVRYYVASGAVTDATACESNSTNPACFTGTISVPISKSETADECPTDQRDSSVEKPVLHPVNLGSGPIVVSGSIASTASGMVQLCSNGKRLGALFHFTLMF